MRYDPSSGFLTRRRPFRDGNWGTFLGKLWDKIAEFFTTLNSVYDAETITESTGDELGNGGMPATLSLSSFTRINGLGGWTVTPRCLVQTSGL
ncbi:hypothetical protein ES703_04167 [subsurface metagenome]|nr:hypothetical protein [bacterium]